MFSKLYIMRHAEAENIVGIQDFDRPLSQKGRLQAEHIAHQLLNLQLTSVHWLVSPAHRTKTTFEILSNIIGIPNSSDIIFERGLYQSSLQVFVHLLVSLPDDVKNLFVIGHNPTISDFITTYCPAAPVKYLSPANLVLFSLKNCQSINQFTPDKLTFDRVLVPS